MKTLRAVPGVGVGDEAEELDVFALLAYDLDKVLAEGDAARVVIGENLGSGGVVGLDLAVHAEHGNAGGLGAADVGNGALGVGAVEEHGAVAGGDEVVEMLGFFCRIVLRVEDDGVVAELFCPVAGGVGEDDEPRIIERGNDDGDFPNHRGFDVGGGTGADRGKGETDQEEAGERPGETGVFHGEG